MQIITTNSFFPLDTNVLIYLHDRLDDNKRTKAQSLLADGPVISTQVISECLNVVRRLLSLSKSDLLFQSAELMANCEIVPTSRQTLIDAARIAGRYGFQIFDSIIIAASKSANCSILYSEDMQHGFTIENMTIVNPFCSVV